MSAILKITDGTTSVSLINGPIYLDSWLPSIPDYKGGGVYADSPIGESRRIVYKQLESVTEAMSIKIANHTQNDTIRALRTLQNLLESAANYWTNPYASTPVYLVAKASREEEARYGTIIRGRIPNLGPIMAQPFTNCATPVLDNISLSIEHHPWAGSVPGSTGTSISLGTDPPNHNVIGNWSFDNDPIQNRPPVWASTGAPSSSYLSKTRAYRGEWSHYVVASGAGEGIQQTVVDAEQDATYTFSAWVYVETGVVAVELSTVTTFANLGSSLSTTTGEWEKVSVTQTLVAQSQVSIRSSGGSATFYVDQAELFIQDGMTNYTIPGATTQYVANEQRHAAIDYIYRYDDGVWSSNLLYEASPQPLTGINDDEATYFGITGGTDEYAGVIMANGGPFNSLVFNISTAIGGTAPTFIWEYLNSAPVWDTLLGTVDRTEAFSVEGVNSVTWTNNLSHTPASLQTTLSIAEGSGDAGVPLEEAYWIRIRKTGGTMVAGDRPIISAPFPYTVTWPYIDLGTTDAPIGGDFSSKGRIIVNNVSGEGNTSLDLEVIDQVSDTYFDVPVAVNNYTLTTVHCGWEYTAGFRFQGLTIHSGSQILSAKIRLVSTTTAAASTAIARMKIRAHDVVDSGALDGYNYAAWIGLPRTTAEVDWTLTGETAAGNVHVTPDFAFVIQEVIDGGFVEGNDMTIFIEDDISDATADYTFASFDNVTYTAPTLEIVWQESSGGVWITRIVAATRDNARGSNFISHINFSDWQAQPGITITPQNGAFFQERTTGAGDRVLVTEAGIDDGFPWPIEGDGTQYPLEKYTAIVTIDSVLAPEYVGEYRAFLRVSGNLIAGETSDFALAMKIGSAGIVKFGYTSAEFRYAIPNSGARASFQSLMPIDLGLVSIPTNPIGGYDEVKFLISAASSTAGRDLRLHDLILMPTDEWIGEIYTETGIQNAIIGDEKAVFDSISNPKRPVSSYHLTSSDSVKALLSSFSREVTLSNNKSQRMFFLFYTVDRDDSASQFGERSSPWTYAKITIGAEKKFLSMRGDG